MAKFELYQKGPEDFYGNIITLNSTILKKNGTLYNGNYQNFPNKFEYPLDGPMIISEYIISDSEIKTGSFSIELTCNIPKCVDVSVKGMDFYGHELPDLNSQYWSKTPVDGTDSTYIINIKNIFSDAFKNSNGLMETIYAACLVFDFKDGTSFVNMSTNSYNETIGEVSDEFTDDTKISYAFMTKPSDVRSHVRIPMYYDGTSAGVFGSNSQLTIESNNPSYLSSNFKGYYIGRSSSSTSNDDVKLGVSISKKYISIDDIVVFLNKTERQQLQNGENVDLCLWMHYTAPRLITPFNQRKIRIIKAY